jgi:hypothetical protein
MNYERFEDQHWTHEFGVNSCRPTACARNDHIQVHLLLEASPKVQSKSTSVFVVNIMFLNNHD